MGLDIQKVKQQNDIFNVVVRYVALSRKGGKFTGLCPFHDDKRPSLVVDQKKQTFVCFACGARGDVVTFVQKIEGCSFKEALVKLGSDGGMDYNRKQPPASPPRTTTPPKVPLPDHNKLLGMLLPYTTGSHTLTGAYLDFEVGVAPHLLPDEWKYLRGRLVFPIRDADGKLVGFAGRLQQDAPYPKYMNTPSEHGYSRNSVLFGMHRAKEAIRRSGRVFVVEGYKDCIALHAAGFTNSVAVCGTELSVSQALLIGEVAEEVVLMPDGDAPGIRASQKMKGILEGLGLNVYVVLPEMGDDPDSLYRRLGPEAFTELVKERSAFPHRLEYLLMTYCVLHPKATVPVGGKKFLFAALLLEILEHEGVQMVKRLHTGLLKLYLSGTDKADWPDEYLDLASALLQEYGDKVMEMQYSLAHTGSREKTITATFKRLLGLYMAERFRETVNGIVRRLMWTKKQAEREKLLRVLKAWKGKQREVGLV